MTVNDGKVICRQLNLTFSRFLPGGYFGRGNSSAILSVNCNGNEPNVRTCQTQAVNLATSNCTHANDVSILCSSK